MENKQPKQLPLDLQFFAAEFTPDNVLLQDARSGEIPQDQGTLILRDVMNNSIMMQLAQYEEMNSQKKTFNYLAEGIGAYWVGEGEIIRTSKPQWLTATMEAKKLGVIVPASREFLNYTLPNFFAAVRPLIAEAFYRKFDEATILNVDNPFVQSLQESVDAAGNIVTGDLNYATFQELIGRLEDNDVDPNAFISKRNNNSAFRAMLDPQDNAIFDRNAGTLDGNPIAYLQSNEMDRGELFAGDFNNVRYGIPYNLNYAISEEAQLSSIVGEDGNPVNLFERELIAIRATMDVAFMVLKDEAFAKIEPAGGTGGTDGEPGGA